MPSWTKEQQEAIDRAGCNIIVSAGAGSGKTAVLTERVIQKVKKGTHINELLILTFTKAAAGEMKDRIRLSLKENNLVDELNLIDSAYITTFDSFALSIVKRYHHLLNISNDISIIESNVINIEKQRIMDEVFETYYQSQQPLFLKLVGDFCTKDDDNLKKCFFTIASKLEMMPDVNSYLEKYIDHYYNDDYIRESVLDFETLVLNKLKDLKKSLKNISYLVDSSYYEKLETSMANLLASKSLEDIISNQNVKLPSLPKGSEDEIKKAKDEINDYLKQIGSLVEYGDKKTIMDNIRKTYDYVLIMIDVIRSYLTAVTDYKRKHEMYEFTDIALLAIEVLKKYPDICKEIKDSLKEILVDEYQDTNDLQEAFINLIANNNVYMVGDIKQSIYRFRNANPYIFKTKYDSYSAQDGGIKIDLVKNFRSRDVVLRNINEIFDLVMDNDIGGAEYHDSHRMIFGNKAYIEEGKTDQHYDLEVLEYTYDKGSKFSKDEIEIFAIANDIKDKVANKYQIFDKKKKTLKDASYSDFVILMDRTTSFGLYKKIFEYVGIPLTLYKDETLNSSYDIYVIKNLIILIIKIYRRQFDTTFKYCFTSVARSFLFEYQDNDIFNLFVDNSFKKSSIYETLSTIDISLLTPTMLIEQLLNKTSFYEKIIKVGDIENTLIRIQKLLEMANSLEKLGYDIYQFSDYLDTLVTKGYEIKYAVGTGDTDSVKIMTIHKSKGLEYPICYFSGLYKTFNISDLKDIFAFSNKYGFIVPYFDEGINHTIYKELLKNDYLNEEISEKIRLFYVALTRAKEKMIMILPNLEIQDIAKEDNGSIDKSLRLKYRSFADIMQSVKMYLSKYYQDINLEKLNLTKNYLFSNEKELSLRTGDEKLKVIELEDKSQSEARVTFSKKVNSFIDKDMKHNLELGIQMHETLEHIDFLTYKAISNSFIDNKIKQFLNSDLLKDIDKAKVYKELEFIYHTGNVTLHGVIDLMLEYDTFINIIDYKLKNIDSDEYIKQLKGYKEYVMTKTNKPIYLYLFSLIDGEIKEIN